MYKVTLEEIVLTIKSIAEISDIAPYEVGLKELADAGIAERQVRNHGGLTKIREQFFPVNEDLKILVLDIETSPLVAYTWGIFDQNIALNQIIHDWQILSWGAKWLGSSDKELMYMDRSKDKTDKKIMQGLWKLLDEADVVLAHNGRTFDVKKVNTRFLHYGMNPPSSYRIIDTLTIARSKFGRTSNKLESLTKELCKKYKKSSHAKFPGFELWKECLAGNKEAWNEMAHYNAVDVLALEELYIDHLRKWDSTINFSVVKHKMECDCGSTKFHVHDRPVITNTGKYIRYICNSCGKEQRSKKNLLKPMSGFVKQIKTRLGK